MKPLIKKIRPAIESLNANYGKGSVGSIRLTLAGEGRFEQTAYQCRTQFRSFRIQQSDDRVTVFALRHQKTV